MYRGAAADSAIRSVLPFEKVASVHPHCAFGEGPGGTGPTADGVLTGQRWSRGRSSFSSVDSDADPGREGAIIYWALWTRFPAKQVTP